MKQVDRLAEEAWPTFMLHADTPYWDSLFDTFAMFQILFCDPTDALVALGHTIPFVWDGTLEDLPPTVDEVMERAVDVRHERRAPTALSALGLGSRAVELPSCGASLGELGDMHADADAVRAALDEEDEPVVLVGPPTDERRLLSGSHPHKWQ